ncbi:MAG: cofactor-independent phosphoglycerate mutase [Oscillospiraceae bacterium]|nr:cofactor-independent phosphoglycerate mutase [Oscillospiraceae bacterium]
MKYIILVGDGMADLPLRELEGRTPLSAARKPGMDYIASKGINGRVHTVPEGMVPESDTANLAIMGYDPRQYSKGRSPLEAASIGIRMQPDETAIRANIVTLTEEQESYEDRLMVDHSSGEITTEEADLLIRDVQSKFGDDVRTFYTGVSYRHCLIWKDCPPFTDFSRPHDIIGKRIGDYRPQSASSRPMWELQRASYDFLNGHPINLARANAGKNKANSLWLWSPGKKPSLPEFSALTGLKGSVVCAVDLIKGIGLCAGLNVPSVPGATGTLDTNYRGKMEAALRELEAGADFVYLHVEAPDECGHQGSYTDKIESIRRIDSEILCPLLRQLHRSGEPFRLLLLPDHPTPVYARTHTRDAVPFVLYDSAAERDSGITCYCEQSGFDGGVFLHKGEDLLRLLLGRPV